MRRVLPLIVVAFLFASSTVLADEEQGDAAAGRALFAEARELAAQGNFEAACPKFEESQRLLPGIGTLFNLADCWEHIGRTASAWARFLEVASLAHQSKQPDREKVARERAAALEPALARLTVMVAQAVEGLEVRRNSLVIGRPLWGSAMPVDPGAYTVTVSAPDRRDFSTEVQVEPGEQESVEVPPLEAAPAPEPVRLPPAVTQEPRPVTAAPKKVPTEAHGPLTLAYVLGGVGVAGLAVAATFGLISKSKNDEALGKCTGGPNRNVCASNEEAAHHRDLVDTAKDFRTVAFVGVGIGGAALIAAGVLFVIRPTPQSPPVEDARPFSGAEVVAVGRF